MFLARKRDDLIRRGIFPVDGEITFDKLQAAAEWIRGNEHRHNCFTLLIVSSGGDPNAVVWFSAFLRTLPGRILLQGAALGECGSAAFALLQLCHWRAGVRGTGFFVHRARLETSVGVHEKADLSALIRKLEGTERTEQMLVNLQCRRIGCTPEQWYHWAMESEQIKSRVILVDEARERNFIDRVITHLPL